MMSKQYLSVILSLIMTPLLTATSFGAVTPEELAREFISGAQKSLAFEGMNGIFLTENEFDSFVLMLRNLKGIGPDTLALVNNPAEVEKARKAFLKDLSDFKKIWDAAVKKLRDEKLEISYGSHTVKSDTRDGLTVYEIEIKCHVLKDSKKGEGSARVSAFMLDGRMKIAGFQYLKI